MILYLSTHRRSIRALESAPTFTSTPFTLSTVSLKINSTLVTTSPEKQPSTLPDEPLLMPKPLQTQAEKLREAEKAVKQQAQQLQNHKQRHAEALSKLSEQHGNAIQEVQVQSEHRLTKQQTAHESVVAGIHAQHIRDVRQIVRKHTIGTQSGNGCSPSKV